MQRVPEWMGSVAAREKHNWFIRPSASDELLVDPPEGP
jgi:hypothetical protein